MASISADEKTRIQRGAAQDVEPELPWLVRLPLTVANNFVASAFGLFRPFAPQVIPLAVFIFTVPLLVLFSVSAGWVVWRSIAVGWETNLYLQYGDGMPPYAQVMLPPLSSQQPYDISLYLDVPASISNYELGNFMASLTLSTTFNKTIASVRRPALVLPPFSTPLSYVWGRLGVVHVEIPLVTSTEMGTSTVVAQVELGRRDQWKSLGRGEGRELSVSSALLRGVVVHQGLRGLLTRFPLLTAIAAAGTFFFISFLILAACLMPMVELRMPSEPERTEKQIEAETEKPPRRKREESGSRRGRRGRSSTQPRRRSQSISQPEVKAEEDPVKTEETVTVIPTAESSSTPLRRRRSRLSQGPDADH